MIPADEIWHLETRHVGRRVFRYTEVSSTNTLASELAADPAYGGAVVLADSQSAGRGQYGRVWQSPPLASILLSALLFPPASLRRPALLTAWAAVAVADVVRRTVGVEPRVKWPNDVLIEGRKVCGILIEHGPGMVAGIGLNLNQSAEDFEAAGLPHATSLALVAGTRFDRDATAKLLIAHLDAWYDRLLNHGPADLENAWTARIGLKGTWAAAEMADGATRVGRVRAFSFDGVVLEAADGSVISLIPETIRHLDAVPDA